MQNNKNQEIKNITWKVENQDDITQRFPFHKIIDPD